MTIRLKHSFAVIVALMLGFFVAGSNAQQARAPRKPAPDTLPDGPQMFESGGQRFRVVPLKGLSQPYSIAFLPDGSYLVTEMPGRLRIVRNGVLDPQPISGIPEVLTGENHKGLLDVALHPRFAENRLVYFTYNKPMPGNPQVDFVGKKNATTNALARGRFDGGNSLTDVRDIFVADAWAQGSSSSRIVFGPDGKIYMSVGMPTRHLIGTAEDAQDPGKHGGKILRLNDDGSAPPDNPFAGRSGYRPEIYALGIRNALALVFHPTTGELWETENGPNGGDELNIIRPGRNYGWPVVSLGPDYSGERKYDPATGKTGPGFLSGPTTSQSSAPGMEDPFAYWNPQIAVSGLVFLTSDKFPNWKGQIIVGALRDSGREGGQRLVRLTLNDKKTGVVSRTSMLTELKQRIRDVRQGPDGLLYLTTDEEAGAVLKIEPVAGPSSQ